MELEKTNTSDRYLKVMSGYSRNPNLPFFDFDFTAMYADFTGGN